MNLFFGIFYYLVVLASTVAVVIAAGSIVTTPVYMLIKAMRKRASKYTIFAFVDIVMGLALGMFVLNYYNSGKDFGTVLTSAFYFYWCVPAFVISFIAAVIMYEKKKREEQQNMLNKSEEEPDSLYREDIINDNELNDLINQLENKEEK